MFVSATSVAEWEKLLKRFEFLVAKDGSNQETTKAVEAKDSLELVANSSDLAICEVFNCDEFYVAGDGES
jgi:hypothetical protein